MIKYITASAVVIGAILFSASAALNQINWGQFKVTVESCLFDYDLCYYMLLLPSTVPVVMFCVLLNWWGLMFFKHN